MVVLEIFLSKLNIGSPVMLLQIRALGIAALSYEAIALLQAV